METFYTSEKHIQKLIALLKAHGIKKIVASPGTTNACLVISLQHDDFFEIISSVDERSAAYIACGLAEESGEPVVLTCTGATASRNYMSGLTEAYYRKLPILTITSTLYKGKVGHNIPQVLDRSSFPNDIVRHSVYVSAINSRDDDWNCEIAINQAILELTRNGGGPVHINLETNHSKDYSVKELPSVRVINRIFPNDSLPSLEGKKVAIFCGAHKKWSEELTNVVDKFCELYNGVVLCDHTSNYKGKYRVLASIFACQKNYTSSCGDVDVLIHIGDISGAYMWFNANQVWRVNSDGEIRDAFGRIRYVFEMEEYSFFKKYIEDVSNTENVFDSYLKECISECIKLTEKIPELPFSNVWIAQQMAPKLPRGCVLHLGILNSLRSWNFFDVDSSILCYSNVGGFGIDGCVSSLIGASLVNPDKLYYGVVGDLAFFYDMNSIGNRHVGNNIRLMVINNGRGTEFRNETHDAAQFGEEADEYIAAARHYGNQSKQLLKHYAQDLGFEYLSASDKDEFMKNMQLFLECGQTEHSIIFEVFTDSKDESDAVKAMYYLETSAANVAKKMVRDVLGDKGVATIKKILERS